MSHSLRKPPPPQDGERYRVLIADDEINLATLLASVVDMLDLEARCVHDGEAAVREVGAWNPHLLLLDVQMPGRSGYEVCKHLRSISAIPILLLNNQADEEREIIGLKVGADDYLTKPFNNRVLAARLIAHLRRVYRYDSVATAPVVSSAPQTVQSNLHTQIEPPTHPLNRSQVAQRREMGAAVAELAAQTGYQFNGFEDKESAPKSSRVPRGWASCERCGYMGPREKFEIENALGQVKTLCPVCKNGEFVFFALE